MSFTWVNNHLVVVEWRHRIEPWPKCCCCLHFGCINAWSAVNKTALIHSTTNEQNLDILAVNETYVKSDHPAAIYDSTPDGYTIFHSYRVHVAKTMGSGIALISKES